ncbi:MULTISPECIES: dUTP diphosphatase [Ureibacillus]|jgi:dimeric dUTPase (all-alpha-NTP-PPase superfamily)|uniref:Dimeric dUTPase (All-alpha-NTP-PPase superfamily) n=1 Tax=Ureibacillus thermosphaericus TaxID=51173 RepID=A0A840PVR7_URETH|nr:dUTP diphosphatase [Ureibacillus thermosphaericus]MBB5148268.1 dimeric dUTPase (all-alpha-NTP-PPase superfamily) [Ureibacillus thermosphaericus]NKZ31176.1 dUTPase [Ureibacillus thermosphaericus]
MEFKELFNMQAQLDSFIQKNQQINRDVFLEKGLALTIELAELANETRCFKYWSTKGPSEREVILEEFVDSIHFLLSLGNEKGYRLDAWPEIKKKENLTTWFLQTQDVILSFIHNPTEDNYLQVWKYYGVLAYNLGFTLDDIIQAYIAKNEKNYERQRNGY